MLVEINRRGFKALEIYNDYSELFDFVDTLPPVTPQPKMEHWYKKELPNGRWICSCSKCDYNGRFEWVACPNCGAKMEVKEWQK